MSDPIETFEHQGVTIEIHPDNDYGYHSDGPREYDNLGTILTFHRSGEYGDVQPEDFDWHDEVQASSASEAIEAFTRLLKEREGATVVIPVWRYTHSGMTIAAGPTNPFHCQWDSGLMGLIYDTPESRETIGTPEERIEEALLAEVETYDQYLRGDVYGYIVDPDGEADSCWGFYGMEDVKAEAEAIAVHIAAERERKADVHRKTMAVWRD